VIRHPFVEAWKYIKKHPHILVPKLVYLAVTALIAFLLKDSFILLGNALNVEALDYSLLTSPEVVRATIFVATYGLFVFFFNVMFSAVLFGLIDSILVKNVCLLRHCHKHIKNYYMPILYTRLWLGLIYFLGALASFVLPMILSLVGFQKYSLPVFIGSAGVIYIALSLALFFRYPILIKEKVRPRDALKDSYRYFRDKPKYTFVVAITTLGVALLTGLIADLIIGFGVPVLNLIPVALDFIVGIWVSMFLFSAYYLKKGKKIAIKKTKKKSRKKKK